MVTSQLWICEDDSSPIRDIRDSQFEHRHRGRLTNALQTYTSLPAHYSNYKWTSLESFMLSRQVSAREKLSKTNDREWVHTVLAYLKVFVENMGKDFMTVNDEQASYVARLVGSLGLAASELTAGKAISKFNPAIFFSLNSDL